MIIASGPPDLSEQLRALEQEFPGWHAWHSDAGIFYATTCKCAYDCGSGTTVEAPTPELLRYEIACQVHQWQIAAVAAASDPDRDATLATLQEVLDVLRANPAIPVPRLGAVYCPLTFYAPGGTGREGLEAIASALGLEDRQCEDRAEEDGWPYLELTGRRGSLYFRIAADDGPLLLEPAGSGPDAIRPAYPLAVAS